MLARADKRHRDRENQEQEQQHNDSITQSVMNSLGVPENLRKVQVKHLWEDHYRVNIFVGTDAASSLVAHSYFLVTGSEGAIIASSPNIIKQY
jgi:hypothetical protein